MLFRVLSLSFFLSFCSLFYELIFAKALTLATENIILAQTLSLGFYFLGMGLGSHYKLKKNHKVDFLNTELVLSFLGMLAPLLIYLTSFILKTLFLPEKSLAILPILLSIPFTMGFYTGKEFLHLIKYGEEHNISVNIILATTYFGNLVAGLMFPLFLYGSFGLLGSSFLGASINLIAALSLFLTLENGQRSHLKLFLLSGLFGLLCYNTSSLNKIMLSLSYTSISTPDLSFNHLKNLYLYIENTRPSVNRHRSKYQDIDIVSSNNNYTLFLNRKPQFSSDNYKAYHLSMIKGFLNLHPESIKKVLILGGGDGILARYLLKENIDSIMLVDLDPYITKLSKGNALFTKLNHKSLKDPKVSVVNADAFSYLLKNSGGSYDAIFIDFPLPTYLELSKLYSTEFYSLVLKNLAPLGGAIFDSPIHFTYKFQQAKFISYEQKIIHATLNASGIKNFTGFGPHENFVYFNKNNQKKHFNYPKLSNTISGRVLINLIENETFLEFQPADKKFVNSIFKPLRIQKGAW